MNAKDQELWVAVAGGASSGTTLRAFREEAEAHGAIAELWGMNAILSPFELKKSKPILPDRWFQIHPPDTCDKGEREWAEMCPVRLYAVQHYPEWPTSVPYPLAEAQELAGAKSVSFASSMAYIVALAILEGVDRLEMIGMPLHEGSLRERLVERPNLAYWIGLAAGTGMRVRCDPGGHPGAVPGGWLYGIEYWEERTEVLRYCEKTQRVKQIDELTK